MTLCVFNGSQCCCQPDEDISCSYLPRFGCGLEGGMYPTPDGAWVRWSDVQRVILAPIKRAALAERNAGVPPSDGETK